MSDDTQTLDQPAPEAPASEEVEREEVELQSETEQPEGETGQVEAEDEFEEVEHGGAKYKVPKAVKPLLMFQQDYTRKTQEVAEQRKAIESERETFTKSIQAEREHIKDLGKLHVIEERLTQYEQVDWQTLRAHDAESANAHFQDYMTLKTQRDGLAGKVHQAIEQQSQEAQRDFAKRYQETSETLARDIKGWNQETAAKVRDFALGNGVTPDQLRVVATTPVLAKLLHKAWLGEQLSTVKPTAQKPAAVTPTVVPQPAARVSGAGARTSVTPENADMEQYVALRKKQGFGKR
jgi:hypothetical protein